MADDVTVDGVVYSADDVTLHNGVAVPAGTKMTQRIKVQQGVDGVAIDVSEQDPLPIQRSSDTATLTSVTASITSVTLLAANPLRRGFTLHNVTSSTSPCYVRPGTTAATNALGGHSFDVQPGYLYEDPHGYKGEVRGIWGTAVGGMNVTEYT